MCAGKQIDIYFIAELSFLPSAGPSNVPPGYLTGNVELLFIADVGTGL